MNHFTLRLEPVSKNGKLNRVGLCARGAVGRILLGVRCGMPLMLVTNTYLLNLTLQLRTGTSNTRLPRLEKLRTS